MAGSVEGDIYIYISNETNIMLHDVYSKFACSEIYLVCVCVYSCCWRVLCLLAGAVVWSGWSHCLHQVQQEDTPTTSQSSPVPLYDDIELPTTTTKHEVELEHNFAYGHLYVYGIRVFISN